MMKSEHYISCFVRVRLTDSRVVTNAGESLVRAVSNILCVLLLTTSATTTTVESCPFVEF